MKSHHHQYEFAFKFGSTRKRPGQFEWINNSAMSDKTVTIAFAGSGNHTLQLFSLDGKFQGEIKLDGTPSSAAFTNCDDLLALVCWRKNKRIIRSIWA